MRMKDYIGLGRFFTGRAMAAAGKGEEAGGSYRDLLMREFGEGYSEITKSFDLLGNIAIIDADKKSAKRIARILMATHRRVETVLRKEGAVEGRYRIRKYSFVAGKRNYVARYTENGATFVFDVRKTFFSPRLAYERKRIVDMAKDGENVVVMFAGVGPFAIEIAKRNRNSSVVAIELNKDSHAYMKDNIRLNKTPNVIPILGDASRPGRKYQGFADRIIMPLPMDSFRFMGAALKMARKGCTVHYYALSESDGRDEIARLRKFVSGKGRRFVLVGKREARPYSARSSEMAIDFTVR